MERSGGGGGGGGGEAGPPSAGAEMAKGRSCKGCLFYSSVLRSRARGPVCVGITRAIPRVPDRIVGKMEMRATREGHTLSDFRYACAGYSIYLDDKDNSSGTGKKRRQLPICLGVEVQVSKDIRAPNNAHPRKEASQPRQYKHGQRDDFLTKFQRNAGLVANGVTKNLNKVGAYVKDTVGDILFPYRKPPK